MKNIDLWFSMCLSFNFLNSNELIMKTNETLTLQALKFKKQLLQDNQDLNGTSPLWMSDAIDKTRNICAFISEPMSEEIDRLCSALSLSKRRFVELALRDMAEQSNAVLERVGLTNITSTTMGEFPVDEA